MSGNRWAISVAHRSNRHSAGGTLLRLVEGAVISLAIVAATASFARAGVAPTDVNATSGVIVTVKSPSAAGQPATAVEDSKVAAPSTWNGLEWNGLEWNSPTASPKGLEWN